MLIDFNLYLNHPYYKKISDYFDHVELINSPNWYYKFKLHDLELTDRLLRKAYFIENEEQTIDLVDLQMKNLIILIVYALMKKHGFGYRESIVNINNEANKLTVSLQKWNSQESVVEPIEKTTDVESVVFKYEFSVNSNDYTNLYERRSVKLFEIDLDNFSFEDIDKQLEEYAKIKDQLRLEL